MYKSQQHSHQSVVYILTIQHQSGICAHRSQQSSYDQVKNNNFKNST